MNPFDYAMQMEQEGEALYRGFAETAKEQAFVKIFTELAGQEKRHYETFKQMKEGEAAAITETPFLGNVKSVFAGLRENKDKLNSKGSEADLYRAALDIEQKSIDFYTEQAGKAEEAGQKEIFEKIAKEESSHLAVIENIIEFITKPDWWVENAEFSKIGEEY